MQKNHLKSTLWMKKQLNKNPISSKQATIELKTQEVAEDCEKWRLIAVKKD